MYYESAMPSTLEYKRFHFDRLFVEKPYVLSDMLIYQIGDLFTKSGYHVQAHNQDCHELTLVVAGEGIHTVDGVAYKMKRGDILLAARGTVHASQSDNVNPFRFYYIGFNFQEEAQKDISYASLLTLLQKKSILMHDNTGFVEQCMKGVFAELVELKVNSSLMIECFVRQIILYLDRLRADGASVKATVGQRGVAKGNELMYNVMQYIEQNFATLENLSHIADSLGYTYPYLSRMFKKVAGVTMREYLDQKRFDKAVEMLAGSVTSITDIAYALNYQSVHAFSKAFKERFGLSPKEYHAMHQSK